MTTHPKHSQKIHLKRDLSVVKSGLFVSVFALVGLAFLLSIHAATPVNNAFEPESGNVTGNATTAADANASNNSYVSFNAPTQTCPAGQTGTPPNCVPIGTVTLPNPGTWTNVTSNLANMASDCGNLTTLSAIPGSNKVIAGVAKVGLYATTNSGGSWTKMGAGAGSATLRTRPLTITYDPLNANNFWVSGIYGGFTGDGGIYKTTDGGNTFTRLGTSDHNDYVSVDYSDPNRQTILTGGHEQTQTLIKSTNGGLTWTSIGSSLPAGTGISSSPIVIDSQTYVMAFSDNRYGTIGEYRTTNGGASWTRTSAVETRGNPLVTANGTIYIQVGQFSSDHLLKSVDKGVTWTEVGSGLRGITPIELPDGRLVSAGGNTLVVSSNGGVSWTAFGAQLPFNPAGVIYSSGDNAFYINQWDCGSVVLANAIEKLQ